MFNRNSSIVIGLVSELGTDPNKHRLSKSSLISYLLSVPYIIFSEELKS